MSTRRYDNRTVIVTGGTQGIGEGCARVFAAAGATVLIASPDRARGAQVAATLTEQGGGRVRFVACDVTRDADRGRLIEEAMSKEGRLDCLVNNAGRHPPHHPIDELAVADFRSLLELNLVSVFALCQRALPHLRHTRGSIVNIASLVATMGQRWATTYAATKGGVVALTKALAIDEAEHGVRVNAISPGNVYTPMWQEAIDAAPDPAAWRGEGEAAQPLGRMGTAEEVGALCLFLAADATFTTGADYLITGGAELGYGRKASTGA